MKIDIAVRFRPFSHARVTETYLPFSSYLFKIYPAGLEVYDELDNLIATIEMTCKSLIESFTVITDLEAGRIVVSGFSDAYIRYELVALEKGNGFALLSKKQHKHFTSSVHSDFFQVHQEENALFLFKEQVGSLCKPKARERLSLGCHKAEDVELIWRRGDIREIVPIWFFMSQSVLAKEIQLSPLQDPIALQEKLFDVAHIGFRSVFVPEVHCRRLFGFEHPLQSPAASRSQIELLRSGFSFIKQQFIKEEGSTLHLLPVLAPQFHSGRLIDSLTVAGHRVSIEWTKKSMRRLQILPSSDDELLLRFPQEITSCIQRSSKRDKKERHLLNGEVAILHKGEPLLLDNFQK